MGNGPKIKGQKTTRPVTQLSESFVNLNETNPIVFESSPISYPLTKEMENALEKDLEKNVELVQNNPNAVTEYLNKNLDLPFENQDWNVISTIATYGTPEQREAALRKLAASYEDYRIYRKLGEKEQQIVKKMRQAHLQAGFSNGIELLFVESDSEEDFLNKFWTAWATEGQAKQGYAILHEYLDAIGPNRNHPKKHNFYERGKPLELNPKIVKILQDQYDETQRLLAESGYPDEGVTLYRGTHVRKGIPMASWTDLEKIAIRFKRIHSGKNPGGDKYAGAEVRTETVPRKYIMGSWKTIKDWKKKIEPQVIGKHEFMVLESSFYGEK